MEQIISRDPFPNAGCIRTATCKVPVGRTWPDPGIRIDLRQARVKTAIGKLTNTFESGM